MPGDTKPETCLFCHKRCPQLSPEDVIPRWYNKELGRAIGPKPSYRNLVVDDKGVIHFDDGVAQRLTILAPVVCTDCNNQWMSRLEIRFKPVWMKLATLRRSVLTDSERLTVASWMTMKAMVMDRATASPDRRTFFTPLECKRFAQNVDAKHTVSGQTAVWLAVPAAEIISSADGKHREAIGVGVNSFRPPSRGATAHLRGFSATIFMAPVAIQLLNVKTVGKAPRAGRQDFPIYRFPASGRWSDFTTLVWPAHDTPWPPRILDLQPRESPFAVFAKRLKPTD